MRGYIKVVSKIMRKKRPLKIKIRETARDFGVYKTLEDYT